MTKTTAKSATKTSKLKSAKADAKVIRTRFAPSPTGFLHIGGLRTALYAYLYAKKKKGKFILRIEDTDQERLVKGSEEVIYRTLKAAGLKYDEGPDVGGEFGPYIQSQRKDTYKKYAEKLVKNGGAYYCFCTKERLEKVQGDKVSKYDKYCSKLTKEEVSAKLKAKEPFVIRQNIPATGTSTYSDLVFGDITIDNKELEDGILIKSDGMPTYNFANVVDDYLMGINVVIRGTEYLSSTPKYNYMYKGLGWEIPTYMHLQPIMRDSQHKLSKRHGDASYEDFISKGFLGEAIVNYIALLGFSPPDNQERMTLKELQAVFGVEGLSKSPSIFDVEKMKWLNSLYIKELEPKKFYKLVKPFLQKLDYLKGYDLEFIANLAQSRVSILSDVDSILNFITKFDDFDLGMFVHEKNKVDKDLVKQMLPGLIKAVEKSFNDIPSLIENFAADFNYKKGQVMWVFRIALTGSLVTPGGASDMAKLFGKEKTIARLKATLDRF